MTTALLAGARRRGLRGALAGIGAVGALSATIPAAGPVTAADLGREVGDSDPRAVLLLAQATRAEQTTAYTGTQYVSAWADGTAATCVVDIEHEPGQGTMARVRPSVGRSGGSVYQSDQPDQPVPVDPLAVPAVDRGPLDLLRHNYQLVVVGAVAGVIRTVAAGTVQVLARRADGSPAARFWIDRESGLAVRREIFDATGQLARASAFVNLEVGGPHATSTVRQQPVTQAVPGVRLDDEQVAAMRAGGWTLPASLPGGMVLYDVRQRVSAVGPVLHLSYSDGLSTVSVFAQEGRLDDSRLDGWRHVEMGGGVYLHDDGLARRVTWNGVGKVYTVVADAPPSAVVAVVTQLPHGEQHRGFWGRIGHGLARLGSWLDPFG